MKTKPNYDYGYIRVEMRSAGDYGGISMSGIHYDNDSHLKEAVEQIERHTDRVRGAEILYDYYTCGECDSDFETEKEADNCCLPIKEIPQMAGTLEALDKLTIITPPEITLTSNKRG